MENKTYVIDFSGNLLARITVENNEITITNAVDGYGNSISVDNITISIEA